MTALRAATIAAVTLLLAADAYAAGVTRGPYLQTPTPSSIVVRWRTSEPCASRSSRRTPAR